MGKEQYTLNDFLRNHCKGDYLSQLGTKKNTLSKLKDFYDSFSTAAKITIALAAAATILTAASIGTGYYVSNISAQEEAAKLEAIKSKYKTNILEKAEQEKTMDEFCNSIGD
ncbi:hypothetical protein KY332_00925 [Candidatus Woesearchaeota archaeon]|nr:hypothetical protein [Candidatus Woesearchaeota archaeon]